MPLESGQTYHLLDGQRQLVGKMTIEKVEDDLLEGAFSPGPAYPDVVALFHEFEQAVEQQALGLVDRFDQQIGALGLSLCSPDGSEQLDVHDVQIWSDGGMSCRRRRQPALVNGPPQGCRAQPAPPG